MLGTPRATNTLQSWSDSPVSWLIARHPEFKAAVVDRLPKTRSGKILRSTMRKIADGEDYTTPATIEDPAVLDEMKSALQSIGYAG